MNQNGEIVDWYNKIHLFEVDIPGKVKLQESQWTNPGSTISKVTESPLGRLALGICYDVRFPWMSTRHRFDLGAEILTFPSAFTVPTGEAGHWHTLMRSRAIENQCYVISAAQVGQNTKKRSCYGHSIVIDPWGRTIVDMGGIADEHPKVNTFQIFDVDLAELDRIRQNMVMDNMFIKCRIMYVSKSKKQYVEFV